MRYQIRDDIPEDEDVSRLMIEHEVEQETAEKAQELIDEGVDEDDAIQLAEEI
jgi:uncharacterized protein YoaH (UPF0181 family)